uniref:Uncharacterized protein n=1 Tax=viral metagenome TaxID=1070528 RepID=A0A6C0J7R0_9ZZZZ
MSVKPIPIKVIKKECLEYKIFLKCRKKKIVIRGNTENLNNLIIFRETGKYIYDESYYARKFLDNFLYKIGRVSIDTSEPLNIDDPVTSVNVNAIPKSHYFEVYENGSYIYDIRSLNECKNIKYNYFTNTVLSDDTINRINRKNKWMIKYGYPHTFDKEDNNTMLIDQLTINVCSHINTYHYMDQLWFDKLNLTQYKLLYNTLNEIWNYRLNLSDAKKKELMPPNGVLCPNPEQINLYTKHMINKLQREILLFVDMLVKNHEGSLYFMLALVTVSAEAATTYPDLYQIVI